ncbi:hypothetical protein NIA71_11460 [Ihubacter massiliensis]|uniref:Uncharacterized protein n=1 Tax=Hominibacterium faecale TaxID=2839743 RepID=A0A9J6QQV7_9FIRM|nr:MULTISPECIES: hypothetical protein [Eubacteriales Family XIII. Incertae Sedis]MCO7122559.1 hypothetical protein [Ihubacter massiliensis]MCU7376835.1 hypothetical protein [Hominibacterium faecale]MCU7379384.1 hypothetical protein [Hominibacterium faecale]
MRKKVVLISLILISSIVVLCILASEKSDMFKNKDRLVKEVSENYRDLEDIAVHLQDYDANTSFYLSSTGADLNSEMTGRLYAVYNTDKDPDNYREEPVESRLIRKAFELEGITEIQKADKAVVFKAGGLTEPNGEVFCGVYYALGGKPLIVEGFQGKLLKKDGIGWSYISDKKYSRYYTEKIEGKWYYYEGVAYP